MENNKKQDLETKKAVADENSEKIDKSDKKNDKKNRKYLKKKKTNEKNKKPPLLERVRLSLALKLSMRSFWRSIAVFFSFNLFVLALVMGFFIYAVSENLADTKNQVDSISEEITIKSDGKPQNNSLAEGLDNIIDSNIIVENNTVVINPAMNRITKKEMQDGYNYTNWYKIFGDRKIPKFLNYNYFQLYSKDSAEFVLTIIPPKFNVSEYGAYTVLQNGDFLLYSFDPFVKVVSVFFIVVLVFEFLSIVNGFFTMSKRIKKTLKPIQMLAESVHSINGYDADTRLYIPGTQNELVDLVAEINGLLDRIQDAYSAQNRFVSDASHELRTPIAVIQGYADLLNRWGKQDEQTLNEGIAAIQNEARNMKNLVDQLLFLARSDHKTTKLEMQDFELTTLVNEVFNEAKMVDSEHEYSINAQKMVWITGDINMIKQLIRIFQENAKKYTPSGGSIKFEVDEEISSAILIIQDDGIGIAQEDIEHIFERFYRVDKSRARKEGGSGLGLAIADQILRFHKGSVDIISREGLGTRVVVRLPLAKSAVLPSSVSPIQMEQVNASAKI